MPIFDLFKKPKLSDEERAAIQAQLKSDLQKGIIEMKTRNNLARADVDRAILKAQSAIQRNDMAARQIAMNELRLSFSIYRYTSAMHTNLQVMESNLALQTTTESFARMVHRFSKLKIPAGKINFNKLTAQALRGIRPVKLDGLEDLTANLVNASLSATNAASIEDSYLEDLISGRISLDGALPSAGAPVDDASTSELLKYLDGILSGRKKKG